MEDLHLVERARAGDHDAFRALVELYQRRAFALALSMLKDRDTAKDAVQEALIKAYKNLHAFEGSSSFATWLHRIVVNQCIDRLRRDRRHAVHEFDETEGDSLDATFAPERLGFDPAQALRDGEIRQRVFAALNELSPKHRAVVVLRELEGLSYREIARAMDCSEGTVMSRLFHARKRLQELLRPLAETALPEISAAEGGR